MCRAAQPRYASGAEVLAQSIVRTINGLRKVAAGLKPFSESVWPGVRNDLFVANQSIASLRASVVTNGLSMQAVAQAMALIDWLLAVPPRLSGSTSTGEISDLQRTTTRRRTFDLVSATFTSFIRMSTMRTSWSLPTHSSTSRIPISSCEAPFGSSEPARWWLRCHPSSPALTVLFTPESTTIVPISRFSSGCPSLRVKSA